jgi:cellulose/xylan binding protein with CBM9 domain/acetyl xylan esterase AXE1
VKSLSAFISVVVTGVSLGICSLMCSAAELPKTLPSAPCRTAPSIDGKIGDEEWKEAKVVEFDLPVLQMKTQKLTQRSCQLRVMNSANGLYVALRVPDETVNGSLAPLDFDIAMLAFCRGKELAAGDDRKAVAVNLYIDKHVTTPGKDADDKQQDGQGAMFHDKGAGAYSIEWALPLNSKDKEDLQAKPGDAVRFNLAYFDAFQFDMKETQIGAAYPGKLDSAAAWGTLQLAADVPDDGGAAFAGPAWVRKLFDSFQSVPTNRLRLVESSLLPNQGQQAAKALVEYTFKDPLGKEATGRAKLYLPATTVQPEAEKQPLFYAAGYEIDDATALGHVGRGFVVVNPRALEANPLVRTVKPDSALLHIARSLPFVDDARVIIAGGSAGGYITLMLAAETFPLAGAAPNVPPVNWGYNAAYFLQRERGDSRKNPSGPKTPVFDVIVPIIRQAEKVYGTDQSDMIYFRNSPLAHVSTITCPVSVYWSTADMLVPIDQVGAAWIRPFDTTKFPAGFTFAPDKLTTAPEGRVRVTDVLKEQDYELFVLTEKGVKQQLAATNASKKPAELSISATKQWSITIVDEGPPEAQVGHTKYPVPWSQQKFIAQRVAGKIAASQLTSPKLQRLMDRYAGREWLPTTLAHLDDAESERVDVVRGLKTFVAVSREHAQVFADLYSKLPADKQILPANVVGELQGAGRGR